MDKARRAVKDALRLIATEMHTAALDLLDTGARARCGWRWDADGSGPKFCGFDCDEHMVTATASEDGTSLTIEDDGRAQRFAYSEARGALVREGIPGDELSDPAGLIHTLIYARILE